MTRVTRLSCKHLQNLSYDFEHTPLQLDIPWQQPRREPWCGRNRGENRDGNRSGNRDGKRGGNRDGNRDENRGGNCAAGTLVATAAEMAGIAAVTRETIQPG